MISDAHEGIQASVAKVMSTTWQRCRVHFMRNVLARAGRSGRRVVSAFIATAFAQEDAEAARQQWRRVADQLRPKVARLVFRADGVSLETAPQPDQGGEKLIEGEVADSGRVVIL